MSAPDATVDEVVVLGDGRELVVARPRDPEALLDDERFTAEDEFIPYWAELWPSGNALARDMARRSLGGRSVLELGCGLGLGAIGAGLAGARATATDWAPEAVAAATANAARNDVAVTGLVADLFHPDALLDAGPFDLVIGADVLYEERLVDAMLDLLPKLTREVIITDPGRLTSEHFLERCDAQWERTAHEDQRVMVHHLRLRPTTA